MTLSLFRFYIVVHGFWLCLFLVLLFLSEEEMIIVAIADVVCVP